MSLTGGKEGVMRCHMSSETWEAVVKAVEELRVPLKPFLRELGVSKSSYYGKRSGSRYHLLAFEWLWVGIYAAIDVESRWAAYVKAYLWRSGASSVEFFMNASAEGEPEKLVTDKGSESISRDAEALLKVEGVEWQGPPQNTPEAKGLIERLDLTMKRERFLWKGLRPLPELRQSLQEFTIAHAILALMHG